MHMQKLPSIIAQSNIDEMLKLVRNLPAGSICEIGVFHGGSASHLYQVAQEQGRELHLFDTFSGTPYHIEQLDKHKIDSEFAAPEAPEKIRQMMPEAKLHIGIYPETHPVGLKDIAFIHCDCDQYLSYIAVIRHMWPLVVPNGVLLFDDYPYLGGAKKAVEENFHQIDLQKCGGRYYVVK